MQTFTQYKRWLLSIIWAGVIFAFSGDSCSSAASAGIIARIFAWFSIPALLPSLGLINVTLRKAAHLSEYGIFAALLYYAIKPTDELYWSRKSATWAILLAAAYSLTDEFHQIFVAGRCPSLFDCLIDTTGAAASLLIVFASNLSRPSKTPFHQPCDPRLAPLK